MSTDADARGRVMVLTLLDSGARSSELCGLSLDGLDLETGEVRVQRGKGGKDRHVAVGMRTLAALHVYAYRYRPVPALPALGEPLFVTQEGYPMTRGSLYLCIRRLRARCGIPRLTVHLFRHTFAVSYLKAGEDVLTLQRILGHTSLHMVNHYVHLAHSDIVAQHRRHSPVDRLQLPRAVDRVTRGRSRYCQVSRRCVVSTASFSRRDGSASQCPRMRPCPPEARLAGRRRARELRPIPTATLPTR